MKNGKTDFLLKKQLLQLNNFLYTSDLSIFKTHFNSSVVFGCACKQVFHNSFSEFSCFLVCF